MASKIGIPKKSASVLKCCILGEGGVGKTTLTKRLITGRFDESTKMTIGIDFQVFKTSIFDPKVPEDSPEIPTIDLNVQVWDFGGEERFRFILPRYCKGAVGGLLLYDLSRFSTTKYLSEWYTIWKQNAPPNSPLVLVGTKTDLLLSDSERESAYNYIKELSQQLGIPKFFVISSKTNQNVHIMINELLKEAYMFNLNLIQ